MGIKGRAIAGGVAALVLVSCAQAPARAAPWASPGTIAGLGPDPSLQTPGGSFAPTVGFTAAGRGVVLARGGGTSRTTPLTTNLYIVASTLGPDDLPGPVWRATPDGYNWLGDPPGEPAFYGADGLVLAGVHGRLGAPAQTWVATGRIGATLAQPQPLGLDGEPMQVAAAADRRGDVAVLVQACAHRHAPCFVPSLYLFTLRVGQSAGRATLLTAQTVGIQQETRPALAMSDRGDVLAVWSSTDPRSRSSVLYARMRSRSGRLLPAQPLGSAGDGAFITAALGPGGQAIVGWSTETVLGVPPIGSATVRVAFAHAGQRFARATRLDEWRFGHCPSAGGPAIQAAIDGSGPGLIAWEGRSGDGFVVRYARVDGRVGIVRTASPPDPYVRFTRLVIGSRGEALLLWNRGRRGCGFSGPASLNAAVKLPGRDVFNAPELVVEGADVYGGDVAIDPVSSRAVAVWMTYGQSTGFYQSASYAVREPIG